MDREYTWLTAAAIDAWEWIGVHGLDPIIGAILFTLIVFAAVAVRVKSADADKLGAWGVSAMKVSGFLFLLWLIDTWASSGDPEQVGTALFVTFLAGWYTYWSQA